MQRRRLDDVERLALRHAFGDVVQDDLADFPLRCQQSDGAADLAGTDERDLVASHILRRCVA